MTWGSGNPAVLMELVKAHLVDCSDWSLQLAFTLTIGAPKARPVRSA